jgi:drug/metabolite transporter (DMT)-like permease
MSLFEELKRRKVFKVGVGYLVVAWLVVQVASIGFPTFEAPPWALRVFILVVLLGFPISLLFAWAFDVTPEGIKAERASTGNKRFLLVAVALVGLAFAWYFKGQPTLREPPQAVASTAPAARRRRSRRRRSTGNRSRCCPSPT